jgi:hypothetical protein
MLVNGCDCSIVIKTSHCEKDIPYSDETLREAVSILQEEAAIEGNGVCRGIRKPNGVSGCVVTPLTIGTVPLLLYLAMGTAGNPVYVSETRNLYQYQLNLVPMKDADQFDLIQDRGGERLFFEGCRVIDFELRIMREEALKLKLGICGERNPITYPYADIFEYESGERFNGDCVTYKINGQEYKNIYGITLISTKQSGTKTEIWIKRALQHDYDIPAIIDEMTITAQLLKDKYEYRHFGTFRITLKRLVLISDETQVNTSDAVINPLRFYVADTVSTEVFTSTGEPIA